MFFFGDFCEVAHDDGSAPLRWRWSDGSAATVRFAVRAAWKPRAGLVRVSFAPGLGASSWVTIKAEPDPNAPSGLAAHYRPFQAQVPAPDGEAAGVYEFGFRQADGSELWSGRRRPLMFSRAPTRLADIPETLLDFASGGPIYGPEPKVPITAAPADWRARTAYGVIIDRFARGTAGRQGLGLVPHDPASTHASHGGTLDGLREKLPYLKDLGVGVLMLSPVYVNGPDGYHGYHPLDLLAIDPRLGDLPGLCSLIEAAHGLDIAVTLDMLVNHIAPAIIWRRDGTGHSGTFQYDEGRADSLPIHPAELRDPAYFHDPESDDDEERGRLFGFLEDWRTELPPVRAALIKHLKYWLSVTNVDGFRYDAVRHVDEEFWRRCTAEIARYAQAIGKTGFAQFGEHSSPDPEVVGRVSKTAAFDGMVDYPLYYALRDHMRSGGNDTSVIAARLDRDCFAYRDSRMNLAFMENHDVDRILADWRERWGRLDTARAAVRAALALVFFGPEIPMLYYGIEQEFEGRLVTWTAADGREIVDDAYVREDMFQNAACVWRFGPLNAPRHPAYDQTNPTYQAVREMAALRRREPALNAGDRRPLYDGRSGLQVFAMTVDDQALVVAVNLGRTPDMTCARFEVGKLVVSLWPDRVIAPVPSGAETIYQSNQASARWIDDGLGLACPPLSVVVARLIVA